MLAVTLKLILLMCVCLYVLSAYVKIIEISIPVCGTLKLKTFINTLSTQTRKYYA